MVTCGDVRRTRLRLFPLRETHPRRIEALVRFAVPRLPHRTRAHPPVLMSSAAPVEREVKIPLSDPATAVATIAAAGFVLTRERVFEANMVYDTPEGSVRARGELLRLREAGGVCTLTWKGPASTAGGHKQRTEVETTVGDAQAFDTILRRLGYVPRFRYEKYRTEFGRPGEPGVVTLDETPVGWFAELEGDADWIDATAAALGFSPAHYVTSSYASVYVEHCRRTGQEPGWMVFPQGYAGWRPHDGD
jgi:adenylate cyclase, class 2